MHLRDHSPQITTAMKKILLFIIGILACAGMLNAQEKMPEGKVKVYCEVRCVQYNLFQKDLNAIVDFGIADKAKNAKGWIYNSETNKKQSFASPMSVFRYMAENGWEYKDAIVVSDNEDRSQNVWHYILTKDLPIGYTDEDIIGNIDYRTK